MEFSVRNVLCLLTKYRGRPYIQPNDPHTYRWVGLLPDDIDEMKSDILYVCPLSEAMRRNHLETQCHFVCISDRYLSDEEREDEEMLKNIILLDENRSVAWLLSIIQERFLELENWEHEMQDVLLRDGSYQDLLDVSEKHLKNSLFVLDAAYRLVAYSKNYMSRDPINISLYKNGYHTQETLQKMYNSGRLKTYENTPGIVSGEPGPVAEYESLLKWLRCDGVPLLNIVEVFTHSPRSTESPELFDKMLHYMNICFLREQKRSQNLSQPYSSFMRDMIYGELTDPNKIESCAKRTGVPMSGFFDVYRITFKDNGKVLIGRFAQELASKLSSSRIIVMNHELSVMNVYQKPNVEALTQCNIQCIMPLLEQHGAELGISSPFYNFTDLRHACLQAEQAIICGNRLDAEDDNKSCIYNYDKLFLYHMIHLSSSDNFNFFRNNIYVHKLEILDKFDKNHDGDLTRLLFYYLYYERRATDVGIKMNMHRNTVMYHINRIRELIDADFDDYMTRQGLLIAYHYMKYNSKQ